MNPSPIVAYVLLWFPKPTETFVFAEVAGLRRLGLMVEVFTLYGPWRKKLSTDMAAYDRPVTRLGLVGLGRVIIDLLYWLLRRPGRSLRVLGLWLRRWRTLETAGEALWCVLGCFSLARWCKAKHIGHIHAGWADGPATAAWAASILTGLPFSFAGLAHDIYPPDGALHEKLSAAAWARTDTAKAAEYLRELAPKHRDKIVAVRACSTLGRTPQAELRWQAPYRLLGVGRMVDKKGFDVLLDALALLVKDGWDQRLTLAGDGPRLRSLKAQAARLGLADRIDFPGFVTHERISELYQQADLFLAPSRITSSGDRDGIPNVLVEAMNHGVPVAACDLAAISEVVLNHRTGLLARSEDPPDLARAIAEMLGDRKAALVMAQAGRELVAEMFDPQARARELYQLLANQDPPN